MAADIFVIDDLPPEDNAMLQALYSRSPASVVSHLEKLRTSGSGSFMEKYYVGYGHASIGDCGTTTVYIEQVSMLVAKAIQDNPTYSGQEASTRYLDFSKQGVIDPYHHPASAAIQKKWFDIYNRILPPLMAGLKLARPFSPSDYKNEIIWNNAISARAFDIARTLLPVGTTTLLSWTTNLRQARDHLRRLRYHPLAEIRETAEAVFERLRQQYPNSFRSDDMTRQDDRSTYAQDHSIHTAFACPDDLCKRYDLTVGDMFALQVGELVVRRDSVDVHGLNRNETSLLQSRPSGSALPWRLESYGRYNIFFMLDFGSFRDIQRHRNGVCQVPTISTRFGLHPWYINQFKSLLSANDYAQLMQDIAAQVQAISDLPTQGVETTLLQNQYLCPMGMQVLAHVSYSVPQMVYVGELRSGKTVHGSLRPIAQKMLQVLQQDYPGIAIYGDFDADDWTAKRGEQTITQQLTLPEVVSAHKNPL